MFARDSIGFYLFKIEGNEEMVSCYSAYLDNSNQAFGMVHGHYTHWQYFFLLWKGKQLADELENVLAMNFLSFKLKHRPISNVDDGQSYKQTLLTGLYIQLKSK